VKHQDKEAAKALLNSESIDVNCKNGAEETPLHFAAGNGNLDIGELLLERDEVDVNCLTVGFPFKMRCCRLCTWCHSPGTCRS
jgi:ankyrin repeat protein